MSEVLREWNDNAAAWSKYSDTLRTMFVPLTEAMIADAGIAAGQSVLDVAGGPGEPSLTIATVVGPTGSVTHTDAVPAMVATAEQEAVRRGLTNMRFQQCLADSLPFADDSFDVVLSRLGVMFFPDVVAGLREMLRVTKPRGAICLVVWGPSEANPFTSSVTKVMQHYVPLPPAEPDAPGAFRFSGPGRLAGLLTEAGATDVRERELNFRIAAPITAPQYWQLRAETSGTLREKLATLSEDKVQRAGLEVQEVVREFFPNDQMSFPAQMIVVSGRKEAQKAQMK